MTEQPTGDVAGRCVLDEAKRRAIVALVANGSSRRVAARYVGCAPSTITRTAARDPEFSQQLARAEHLRRNRCPALPAQRGQEVIQMLVTIMLSGEIPEKYCQRAVQRLERLLAESGDPGAPEKPQDAQHAAGSSGREKASAPVSGRRRARRRRRRHKQSNTSP